MRILLIDDDASVLENLALYLGETRKVETLTHVANQEALQEVLARFEPDEVLLDYGMERLGTELYSWIRAERPAVAIVFYTKYAHGQERAKMRRVGARDREIIDKQEVGQDLEAILTALHQAALARPE